jgi:hypothetical protein
VYAAFDQLGEHPMWIAQERLPELLVGHQPANHDLYGTLRNRSFAPIRKASAAKLISRRAADSSK